MRKLISAGLILPLLLGCMVFPIFAGSRGGVVNEKSAYDRLLSVEKWQVSLHLVYDHKESDGSSEHVISTDGESIKVKWEIAPARERELKYRETALDVAAMNYPGKAVDPHVFEVQAGGGSSWIPHANFAGEVWVDGVNKVKIRTGPGPSPRDAAGRAQNVTSEYMIVREVRSWDMNRITLDWTPDSPDPIQDWLDNAGVDFAAGPPPTWNKRVMTEFLVQVMGHPEIGRVYAAFAMETRKNAYRIRYAESVFLTEEEYDKIKASPKSNFPYPFTDKGEGWVEIVQDPKTGEWKPRGPVQ